MSYVYPDFDAADDTWLNAEAYTYPAFDAADDTWQPQNYVNLASSFASSPLGTSGANAATATTSDFAATALDTRPILGNTPSAFASSYQYSSPVIGNVPSGFISQSSFSKPVVELSSITSSYASSPLALEQTNYPLSTASSYASDAPLIQTLLPSIPSAFAASALTITGQQALAATAPHTSTSPLASYGVNYPLSTASSYASDAPLLQTYLSAPALSTVVSPVAQRTRLDISSTTSSPTINPLGLLTDWTLDATDSSAQISPLATRATTPLASSYHPGTVPPVETRAYNQLVAIPSSQAIAVLPHTPGPIDVLLGSTPSAFDTDYTLVRYNRLPVFSILLSDAILLTRQPLIQVTEPDKLVGLYQDVREWRVAEDVRLQTLYTRQPLEVVYVEEAGWLLQ
jgi:hypothetical protein